VERKLAASESFGHSSTLESKARLLQRLDLFGLKVCERLLHFTVLKESMECAMDENSQFVALAYALLKDTAKSEELRSNAVHWLAANKDWELVHIALYVHSLFGSPKM
jgi:hypothetical protein